MKTQYTAIALILASSLIAGTSFAGDGRGQFKPVRAKTVSSAKIVASNPVAAELAEAIRTGDMMAIGQSGLKLNELYPSRYPAKQMQAGFTREQVKAELAEAIRTGDNFVVVGEIGGKCNEVHPNMHTAI
ncbi:MAG: DUF4148 domain-containing protein [Comamonadaceae bacterium]